MSKKYIFITGLPRAGSTLFQQILNQNDSIHATPTDPIPDLIESLREQFSNNQIFQSLNRKELYNPFLYGLNGFMNNYYKMITHKRVIAIKNRGLTNKLLLYDQIFGHKETKVIYLVRNIVEIVWSMENQHRKTILLKNIDENRLNYNLLEERIERYIENGSILDRSINYLNDAINLNHGERVFILKYSDLINNTEQLMRLVHNFIDEPYYNYDFNNIKQTTQENDEIWNNKFIHKIKEGSIQKPENKIELPQYLIDRINEKYKNFNF